VTNTAKGTFDVELTPGQAELDGAVSRFDFSKTFHGEITGRARGVMLAGGDRKAGAAGYVAIEVVDGVVNDRRGSFALQQLGTMSGGSQTLHYEVVPGSGKDELAGISGTFQLTIENGVHHYELAYEL
jgi:hypothetical protein